MTYYVVSITPDGEGTSNILILTLDENAKGKGQKWGNLKSQDLVKMLEDLRKTGNRVGVGITVIREHERALAEELKERQYPVSITSGTSGLPNENSSRVKPRKPPAT